MPGNSWPSVFSRYKDQDSLETEWVRRKCAHHQRMEWDGVGGGEARQGLSHFLWHYQVSEEPEVGRHLEHWLSSLAIPFIGMGAVVREVRTVWLDSSAEELSVCPGSCE